MLDFFLLFYVVVFAISAVPGPTRVEGAEATPTQNTDLAPVQGLSPETTNAMLRVGLAVVASPVPVTPGLAPVRGRETMTAITRVGLVAVAGSVAAASPKMWRITARRILLLMLIKTSRTYNIHNYI